MSQQGLADASGMSRRWVLDLEHGRVDPKFTEIVKLGWALRVPIESLLAEQDGTTLLVAHDDQSAGTEVLAWGKLALSRGIRQVDRREFMRWAATIGIAVLTDAEHLALAADPNLTDDLYQLNLDYGRRARTSSPRTLVPVLRGHLSLTKALLDRASGQRYRELLSIAGEAAALTGTLAFRADNRGDAGLYLQWALRLAEEADDRALQAVVLTMLRGIYSSVPSGGLEGDTALALAAADEACQTLGHHTPAIVRTYALVSRAEEYAVIGDEASCRNDLEHAETAFAQVDLGQLDGYFYHWNSTRLASWRGNCELLLGNAPEAVEILSAVHSQTRPEVIGFYTAATADLAAAHARLDEPERACELLHRALDVAAPAGLAANGVSRVIGVRQHYLDVALPPVRDLDERIRGLTPRPMQPALTARGSGPQSGKAERRMDDQPG